MPRSKRLNPAKCTAGLHDWVPENLKYRKFPCCRLCENMRAVERRARKAAGEGRVPGKGGPNTATLAFLEDFEFMRSCGETTQSILRRMGREASGVERLFQRHGLSVSRELRALAQKEHLAKRRAREAVDR
jgi:hypothetical protein